MTGDPRPDWWRENERLREALSLPPYEPPRFADGTYVHEVVPAMEERHGWTIRLLAVNPRYPDDWEVRVDGERRARIGRHRDEDGNTVYELTADEFRAALGVADAD